MLSEFRTRLITGSLEQQLLDTMLTHFKRRGWLKARGKQRTDSTHVLATIRTLNRLETLGETLRATLNTLSAVAPEWLQAQVQADWFERYSLRIEEYRLPKGQAARQTYAETIGADGFHLLAAIYTPCAPAYLRALPIVDVLRQVWLQQYVVVEGHPQLRDAKDLPPAGCRIESPYDPDARYGNKRSTTWSGYKVHLTETCDEDQVHLITHVETTEATRPDVDQTAPTHAALAQKELLPKEHLLDAGYVDADLLLTSPPTYGVDLLGPVRPNASWQAKAGQGYDVSAFTIDWDAHQVTCPQGQTNSSWSERVDRWNNPIISVKFSRTDCRLCAHRTLCTKAKTAPRHMTLRPQEEHEKLQAIRQQQSTPEWKEQYNKRAGIEGTLSQAVRVFELRKTRYVGLAKTRLQHILTASVINIIRMMNWLGGIPHVETQPAHFAALAPQRA